MLIPTVILRPIGIGIIWLGVFLFEGLHEANRTARNIMEEVL